MTDTKYSGWTNYETWLVKLWMDNDEGSYHYWQEIAEELWDDSDHDCDDFLRTMSTRLKDEHEEQAAILHGNAGIWADLIGAALSEVNWYEITESYQAEFPPEEESEEEITSN